MCNKTTIIEILELSKENKLNNLYEELKSLRNRLNIEIKNIEKCKQHNVNYSPNSLGIVQEQGRTIDLYCANISTQQEIIDILKANK